MIRLTVLSGARNGACVERMQPVIRLGRAPDNDLPFDPNTDLDASAYHAEIRADQGRWVLVDMGSRNGVFLPMQGMARVQQHVLGPVEQIQIGPQGPRVQIEVFAPPPMQQQQGYPQQPQPPPQQGVYGAPQNPPAQAQ